MFTCVHLPIVKIINLMPHNCFSVYLFDIYILEIELSSPWLHGDYFSIGHIPPTLQLRSLLNNCMLILGNIVLNISCI